VICVAPVAFGGVIYLSDIRLNRCGKVAGDRVPCGFVHRPGRPVVAARGYIFIWNLSHVLKLVPNVRDVDAAHWARGRTSRQPVLSAPATA
jgi:hypothetical protein